MGGGQGIRLLTSNTADNVAHSKPSHMAVETGGVSPQEQQEQLTEEEQWLLEQLMAAQQQGACVRTRACVCKRALACKHACACVCTYVRCKRASMHARACMHA